MWEGSPEEVTWHPVQSPPETCRLFQGLIVLTAKLPLLHRDETSPGAACTCSHSSSAQGSRVEQASSQRSGFIPNPKPPASSSSFNQYQISECLFFTDLKAGGKAVASDGKNKGDKNDFKPPFAALYIAEYFKEARITKAGSALR